MELTSSSAAALAYAVNHNSLLKSGIGRYIFAIEGPKFLKVPHVNVTVRGGAAVAQLVAHSDSDSLWPPRAGREY